MSDERILFQCVDNKDMEWTYNGFPIVLNNGLTSTACDNTKPMTVRLLVKMKMNLQFITLHYFLLARPVLIQHAVRLPSTNCEAKTTPCPYSITVL